MDEKESSLVHFTPAAIGQLKNLKRSLHLGDERYLRIGVKGGGCGVPSFLLAFDEKNEKDEEFLVQGQKIIVTKGQTMYILGMTIDYVEEGVSKGFVFLVNS